MPPQTFGIVDDKRNLMIGQRHNATSRKFVRHVSCPHVDRFAASFDVSIAYHHPNFKRPGRQHSANHPQPARSASEGLGSAARNPVSEPSRVHQAVARRRTVITVGASMSNTRFIGAQIVSVAIIIVRPNPVRLRKTLTTPDGA
jgi:hypothetical protein